MPISFSLRIHGPLRGGVGDFVRSSDQLQRQQTYACKYASYHAQARGIELLHLLGHSLPDARRGEQEKTLDNQHQAQRGQQIMHRDTVRPDFTDRP